MARDRLFSTGLLHYSHPSLQWTVISARYPRQLSHSCDGFRFRADCLWANESRSLHALSDISFPLLQFTFCSSQGTRTNESITSGDEQLPVGILKF